MKKEISLTIPVQALIITCFLAGCTTEIEKSIEEDISKGIHISEQNPMYWQYNGQSLFLFGGSSNDNLHQNDNLTEELDLIDSLGGNFVRGNLSWRDSGNVKPYEMIDGLYDLNRFNDAYWNKLDSFVKGCEQREIIIQLEIWPTVDFHKFNVKGWLDNPFNPAMNSNYPLEESGLPAEHDYFHWEKLNPFFETVPGLSNDNPMVRSYQERFVDKVLSITLASDNVLYCMNNENYTDPSWGQYWIRYIRQKANSMGKNIYLTDMWDEWDITNRNVVPLNYVSSADHPNLGRNNTQVMIDHPEYYDFIEVSNNGAQFNEIHYSTLHWVYKQVRMSEHPRPINVDKIYGGPVNERWTGGPQQGAERFWRNLFAGLASARFHRKPYGNGIGDYAQIHVKSMAMLLEKIDLFNMEPDPWFVTYKGGHEVYTLSNAGQGEYAVIFLDGGRPGINFTGMARFHWLDVMENRWLEPVEVNVIPGYEIIPPGNEFMVLVIQKK